METEKEHGTRNKEPETRYRRDQLMLFAPLVIWIGVIFLLSSSQGSMTQTSRFIRPLLEFLFPAAPEETLIFYHGIIRKLAHFTEYFILGLLACRAFRLSAASWLQSRHAIFALMLVSVVAIADETNQSFNSARTGSPIDVLIDISGGLVAIAICYWFSVRRKAS